MPARKVVNYEGGSDARYDTSQMQAVGDGRLTDGTYYYDSEGRPLDAIPGGNDWTPGLPGARGGSGPGDLSGGGGGSNMFGNPYFQQFEAANRATGAADLSDTKAQIQQLLISFGLVPGNFQDKLGALDDTIRQLIEQNTKSGISQYARLLENKDDVNRGTISRLGSRGLLRSGAKGYRLRRNTLDFDRSLSDVMQAVLGSAGQLQSGYAGRESQRQMSLAQFLSQLFSTWRGGGGGGGFTPSTPSAPQVQSYTPAPVTYNPAASQSNIPFFNVPGGRVAGGVFRAGEDLF